jgi:hypothetical protein
MKFNKWTLGLATVGVVSLASAVRADEAKMSQLQTALSNTTISGYVDVAAQYNTGNQHLLVSGEPAGTGNTGLSGASKVDSFTLNDVDVAIDKPEDDTPWASGYHVDLNWGSDAIDGLANVAGTALGTIGGGSAAPTVQGVQNFGVRQAYVVIRTPVGNGIDWKVGVQDDIIGYEGNTDGGNPNYTRSVGYSLEPTTLTGIVGTYQICKAVSVQAGLADATSGNSALSSKTFVGAVALTAPDNWGWAKGATLNAGTVLNIEKGGQNNFYVGTTIPTPWSMLKVGGAVDIASVADEAAGNPHNDSGWDLSAYANLQATDKLSFNLRGEFYDLQAGINPYGYGESTFFNNGVGEEVTATVQYNLWANVISRVEFRWDHSDTGEAFAGSPGFGFGTGTSGPATADSFILAANLIYTF